MGIETFFSALAGATRSKQLIQPFARQAADAILFDFNSIIHRTSQILIEDLNRAMRRLYVGNHAAAAAICKKYATICDKSAAIVAGETSPAILASCDIHHTVINLVIKTVADYVDQMEGCKTVYLAMDGVPGYGKMREQKHRRYLGEVSSATAKQIASRHMSAAGFVADTPYDYANYYKNKLSFNKSLITPGTQFMRDLCGRLRSETTWTLSDFDEFGEGEMKIINVLATNLIAPNAKVVVYSPDADMILLCLLEQGRHKRQLALLRHDQRAATDSIVDIAMLRGFMEEHGSPEDLVFLFSVFGDDFVPRLEAMSARDHLTLVLDLYKKHLSGQRILLENGEINMPQLRKFFELLGAFEKSGSGGSQLTRKRCRNRNRSRRNKTRRGGGYGRRSTFVPEPEDGPLINALHEEVHNFMNMEGRYAAKQRKFTQAEFYKYYNIRDPAAAATSYLQGLRWLRDYYYDGVFVTHWTYGYEKAPFISDILKVLKELNELPAVPADMPDAIMAPAEHLVYVSPGNVAGEAADKKTASQTAAFYERIGLPAHDWAEHVKVDCTNAPYRSKCRMENVKVPLYHVAPYDFLRMFRSDSSSLTPTFLVLFMGS